MIIWSSRNRVDSGTMLKRMEEQEEVGEREIVSTQPPERHNYHKFWLPKHDEHLTGECVIKSAQCNMCLSLPKNTNKKINKEIAFVRFVKKSQTPEIIYHPQPLHTPRIFLHWQHLVCRILTQFSAIKHTILHTQTEKIIIFAFIVRGQSENFTTSMRK